MKLFFNFAFIMLLSSSSFAANPVKINQISSGSGTTFQFFTSADGCVNGTNQWYKINPALTSDEQKIMQSMVLMAFASSKDIRVVSSSCDSDPLVTQINIIN